MVPVLVWLYLFLRCRSFRPRHPGLLVRRAGAGPVGPSGEGGARRSGIPRPRPAGGRAWRSGSLRWQLYRHVLLPQALQRLTPPTINIYTRIIKTSSLAVLIGVVEVIKVGQQIIERTYGSLLIYGLLFLLFSGLLSALARLRRLEQQWGNAV